MEEILNKLRAYFKNHSAEDGIKEWLATGPVIIPEIDSKLVDTFYEIIRDINFALSKEKDIFIQNNDALLINKGFTRHDKDPEFIYTKKINTSVSLHPDEAPILGYSILKKQYCIILGDYILPLPTENVEEALNMSIIFYTLKKSN